MANEKLDTFPALVQTEITPNAVNVLLELNENLITNYRTDQSPNIDFPSFWRLAKHVVHERSPLLVFRFEGNK